MRKAPKLVLAGLLVATMALAGCGQDSGQDTKAEGTASGSLQTDQALHDSLPASIKSKGEITVVNMGAGPPYWTTEPGNTDQFGGAGYELTQATAKVLGVKVKYVSIKDISGAIASVESGRYDYGFSPFGDTVGSPTGRKGVVFVDVVKEVVPFLVKKGHPKNVQSLDTLCDINLAVLTNGSAYKLAQKQQAACKSQGKNLTLVGVKGTSDGVLALRSGRADALFSSGSGLFHAAKVSNGEYEVVGLDKDNGFPALYQGAVLKEGSGLTQPLLKAFEKIIQTGDYARIMKKYGLEREMLDKPGINLFAVWYKQNGDKP